MIINFVSIREFSEQFSATEEVIILRCEFEILLIIKIPVCTVQILENTRVYVPVYGTPSI